MNNWIGIGRLVRDVEVRYTNSGTAVASFTLAVDRNRKDSQGNKQTDFINVVAWQKLGELCSQYLSKGRQAAVQGELTSRSYQNKEGQKVTLWEINASNVQFLDKPEKGDSNVAKPNIQPNSQPQRSYGDDPFADESTEINLEDESLPF